MSAVWLAPMLGFYYGDRIIVQLSAESRNAKAIMGSIILAIFVFIIILVFGHITPPLTKSSNAFFWGLEFLSFFVISIVNRKS